MPTIPLALSDPLAALLKQTFGFDTFRALQREIMEEILAGRDPSVSSSPLFSCRD